jgi:hypothetical protein
MSATVTDIAEARALKEFTKRLIEAANKANALRFARWQAIANKGDTQ